MKTNEIRDFYVLNDLFGKGNFGMVNYIAKEMMNLTPRQLQMLGERALENLRKMEHRTEVENLVSAVVLACKRRELNRQRDGIESMLRTYEKEIIEAGEKALNKSESSARFRRFKALYKPITRFSDALKHRFSDEIKMVEERVKTSQEELKNFVYRIMSHPYWSDGEYSKKIDRKFRRMYLEFKSALIRFFKRRSVFDKKAKEILMLQNLLDENLYYQNIDQKNEKIEFAKINEFLKKICPHAHSILVCPNLARYTKLDGDLKKQVSETEEMRLISLFKKQESKKFLFFKFKRSSF